ncbi:hypothetical protein M885DRAFT_514474 [Pelagophyceae sp. CCMP2097]|nr:hypothetical protein M885DRAFT_514474 [Pelagophyceae sp. CCMP2097]
MIRVLVCAALYVAHGCVLHGTDSGVCDSKFDPGYEDLGAGWTKVDTFNYRTTMMPHCQKWVRYPACVPEMELVNATAPWSERYKAKIRIDPSPEFPEGRFTNHTILNKDSWVYETMEWLIDWRLAVERDEQFQRREVNEYDEGNCADSEVDPKRCDYPVCTANGDAEHGGCVGYPIEVRMHHNQDCREALRRYFCYTNFPRCHIDARTGEHKSVALCRSACKNFFKACNYDKSLHRCGRTEWFNGGAPEVLADYGRYMRDFFPGQPYRNGFKDKGFRNIDGRCTPGIPDAASTLAPRRAAAAIAAFSLLLRLH